MIAPNRLAHLPDGPPLLQVVVDTEEEFDWTRPFDRTSTGVTSMQAQPILQTVMNEFGVRPTYVIDYPVATTPSSIAVLAAFQAAGQCHIGAHLHPWVSPPHDEDVSAPNSYPGNLPPALERRKLEILTEAITNAFGARPTIYKAGRYGIGPATPATLQALGYTIDLSVVPHSDFGKDGGPDFRNSPDRPAWIAEPGGLLEIPLARGFSGRLAGQGPKLYPLVDTRWGHQIRLGGILSRLGLLERATLTPEGVDFPANRRLIDAMLRQGHRIFTMTYHSPSLAIGHTPYVRSATDLAAFVDNVRRTFDHFFNRIGGRPTTALEIRESARAMLSHAQLGRAA